MNQTNSRSMIIPAIDVMEGDGVAVHRTIGSPALRNYDPFLMLDHISSKDPDDYIAGFPSHPHRGFNTFTYMIDGDMQHKDSMGNTGNLGPGGGQWMKAASGVIHSEMPKQEGGLMRGFQLWINLPAANKFDAPEYQEYKADAFPMVELVDATVKVVIGHYADMTAPIVDEISDVSFYDVTVKENGEFQINLKADNRSFLYLFEGEGKLKDQAISTQSLMILEDDAMFTAASEGARFLLVSGKPINEPIVQYGPFVMNTREEIDQAMRDYQSNNFVRDRAWVNRKKGEV